MRYLKAYAMFAAGIEIFGRSYEAEIWWEKRVACLLKSSNDGVAL